MAKSFSIAEYRAMAVVASKITWLVRLLEELGVSNLRPVTLECENHIKIDCHFTPEKVLEGLIQLSYILTQEKLADVLTKIIPSTKLQSLLTKLGVLKTTQSLRGDVKHGVIR